MIEQAWSAEEPEIVIQPVIVEEFVSVSDLLADLVFKLRVYSEPLNEAFGDNYNLGVEAGCEMAAEMLQNLIRQLSEQ